mmetsp:Transcript_10907/g.16550  ORF Transcript_10907/g.16550 Transcript_10907/m.16550 type:complete len:123 (+) Transcript_10907:149-517(+)|eukprot:CAMPEP_0170490198 /NCGR_PEP_ID=MMETSP0208-20121228/8446_1 /TAXON_ID=197538 /ORGANISM="Strombidium inclinatum, Strain S3" /LENGTH=122 /DNA_ID=CAMNT_0010765481 /DNA_START=1865 /DNA_END=2233 /DNA_ORIENTATION=-
MLEPKAGFGHFSTNFEIFIAGGTQHGSFALNQVHSYDIKQDVWLKQPDLILPRRQPSICLFRNRYVYVFGGSQLKTKRELAQIQTMGQKEDSAGSDLNLDSDEGDDDAISAEVASDDSLFDD